MFAEVAAMLPVPGNEIAESRKPLNAFKRSGVEAFESCKGGRGHAYPEPTQRQEIMPVIWRSALNSYPRSDFTINAIYRQVLPGQMGRQLDILAYLR